MIYIIIVTRKEECVQEMLDTPGIVTGIRHMCRHFMWALNQQGPGLVKKPTRIMSSHPALCEALQRRCCGNHRHVHLEGGGRCADAARYPFQLCEQIVKVAQEHGGSGRQGWSWTSTANDRKRPKDFRVHCQTL